MRVVLPFGGWVRGQQLLTVKIQLLTKCYIGPRAWQALGNMVMNLHVP
jgi:hypothetical protein